MKLPAEYSLRISLAAAILTLLLAIFISRALAADPPKPPELSEVQKLKLQLAQRDAIIAQQASAQAQQNFQSAMAEFNRVCEEIKKDAKFPANAQCNVQQASITIPPEAPKPEPKPDAAKK